MKNLNKIIGFVLVVSTLALGLNHSRVGRIISYNYETVSEKAPIYYPSSVEEVQELIKNAQARQIKVKFSGSSHSTSSVILGSGIYIKSQNLQRIDGIEMDPVHGAVVQVESGVKLGDLADYLGKIGYSLGFSYPYYYGLTIGGLLSTGSHGSSRKHPALSSQNIIELTLVNGLGEIVQVDANTPELLKAARVNLGLLGFVYKVKLKVIPDFNIEFTSKVLTGKEALLYKKGSVNWGAPADTEYFYWFPNSDRAVKVEGHITKKTAFPGAQSVVLGQHNDGSLSDKLTYQALAIGKNNKTINKWLEDYRFKELSKSPAPYIYIKDGKEVKAEGVVGKSAKMLISKRTPLNPSYTVQDISFSFRIDDAAEVMNLIHDYCAQNDFYHPISFFLRFAHANGENYISHIERTDNKGNDLYVMAEFFEVKKYDQNDPPSAISRMRKELLQLLTKKNLITFHWGKNTNEIFATQANKRLINQNVTEFNKVRKLMDPDELFLNTFTKEYLLME